MNITTNVNIANTVTITNIETINLDVLGNTTVDMKNITGVKTLGTANSTGNITLNNSVENIALSMKGTNTNNITAVGTNLSGTSDNLKVTLNGTGTATVAVDAGYETLTIDTVSNASTLTSITAVGAKAATLSGNAALTLADNALTGVDTYTITDTAAVKFGLVTTKDVVTLNATANIDGILSTNKEALTTATAIAGQAAATSEIQLDATNGSTVLLGAGNDNVYLTDQAVTGKSNTIKLGAGNDNLVLKNATGNGNTYVFGEDGDDVVSVITGALASTDLIDLGAGTDTLRYTVDAATNLVLRGVENLTLSNAAGKSAAIAISSVDQQLAIKAEIAAADDTVNLTGSNLLNGTSLTTTTNAAGAKNAAGDVTLNFKDGENATTVITHDNGSTGATTVTNVKDLTVNYNAASNTAGAITLDKNATNLTLNATKGAFIMTTIANVANESLAKFTATAADAFTMTDILNSDKLTDVSVTAAKNLSIGDTTTAAALKNFTANSTGGSVSVGKIADTAPATENTIDSITISGATTATVGVIGESTKTDIGTVSITASNGLLTAGAITAKGLTSVTATSTKGVVQLANSGITATDTDGFSVNLSADTAIYGTTNATTATTILNNGGGDITATLAVSGATTTAATSYVNISAASAKDTGSVTTVNATAVKGGLISTITNDELKTIGTSTISLGAKDSSTVNQITLAGYVGKVTVNGSAGKDTIIDTANGTDASGANTVNSSDVFAGGAGVDTISYAGHVSTNDAGNGMAINLSSEAFTFGSGSANQTSVAANTAVEYDATYYAGSTTAANKAVVANGEVDSITGFENVIGTAKDDFIKLGAIAGTVEGGAGDDKIVLGDSADKAIYTGTIANLGSDSITSFVIGTDKLQFTGANIGDGNTTLTFSSAGTIAAGGNAELTVATTALADDAAIIAAIQGSTDATPSLFVVYNTADAEAQVWYDANPNIDGGETQLISLVGVTAANLANITATNFVELV